jgi:hypothetical protein
MANTFKNARATDVGTSYAAAYTAPSGTTTVILGMAICNKSSGAVTVSVRYNDSSSSMYNQIMQDVDVPAGSTLEVLSGQKYILETGDRIDVKSSAATSIDVTMGVMEIS